MNDVMTYVTMGGEIIGRLKEELTDRLIIENPRVFAATAEGAAFVPGVCMTGEKEVAECEIMKTGLILISRTDPQIIKAWQQQTTGLVLP